MKRLDGLAGKCQQSCKHLPGTCQLDQMAISDSLCRVSGLMRLSSGGPLLVRRREPNQSMEACKSDTVLTSARAQRRRGAGIVCVALLLW